MGNVSTFFSHIIYKKKIHSQKTMYNKYNEIKPLYFIFSTFTIMYKKYENEDRK